MTTRPDAHLTADYDRLSLNVVWTRPHRLGA